MKEEVVYPEAQLEALGVDLERLRTLQAISSVARSLGSKGAATFAREASRGRPPTPAAAATKPEDLDLQQISRIAWPPDLDLQQEAHHSVLELRGQSVAVHGHA